MGVHFFFFVQLIKGQAGAKTTDLRTLAIKSSELPTKDNVTGSIGVLFERRFIWESIGQVELCCRSYNACMRQLNQGDDLRRDVVVAVKEKALNMLVTSLLQGRLFTLLK